MGHDKLRKFAENETFACLLQPSSRELLADGYARLRDHDVKGHWRERMFAGSAAPDDGGIVLELGCGKGEYTIELAQRNPARNYVGVDIKGARLWKGAKYATQHALPNVAFLRTRVEFISAFFAPGEVSEIWLTFSDPQFRSENSRLSSPVFLERYRSFLRSGGVVHLKTDSRFLHEYTKAVCRVNGLELLACTADLYGTGKPDVLPAAGAGEADPRAVSSDFFVESADCSDVPADLKSALHGVPHRPRRPVLRSPRPGGLRFGLLALRRGPPSALRPRHRRDPPPEAQEIGRFILYRRPHRVVWTLCRFQNRNSFWIFLLNRGRNTSPQTLQDFWSGFCGRSSLRQGWLLFRFEG